MDHLVWSLSKGCKIWGSGEAKGQGRKSGPLGLSELELMLGSFAGVWNPALQTHRTDAQPRYQHFPAKTFGSPSVNIGVASSETQRVKNTYGAFEPQHLKKTPTTIAKKPHYFHFAEGDYENSCGCLTPVGRMSLHRAPESAHNAPFNSKHLHPLQNSACMGKKHAGIIYGEKRSSSPCL